MTRSITIVNSSNWDGEDYIVRSSLEYDFPAGYRPAEYTEEGRRLQPGESFTFTPKSSEDVLNFEPNNSKEIKPFYKPVIDSNKKLGRTQVLPVVRVTLE